MRKGEEEGKKTRVLQLVQPGAGIDWTRRTHDRIELSSNFSPDAGQRSRVLNFFFFLLFLSFFVHLRFMMIPFLFPLGRVVESAVAGNSCFSCFCPQFTQSATTSKASDTRRKERRSKRDVRASTWDGC